MQYEPVKQKLAGGLRHAPARKMFYRMLGLLFLREWYVKREIRKLGWRHRPLGILDAGAGFGQYSYYCLKRFPCAEILALEINSGHVDSGNDFAGKIRAGRLKFKKQDITTLSGTRIFDLILSVDVLEHIENDSDLLERFSRALTKNGRLIVSTPSVYRRHTDDGVFVGEHFREGYSEEDIRQKFEKAGLQVDRLVYSYGRCGDLSWRMGIRNTLRIYGIRGPLKVLAPLYLLVMLPVVLPLMAVDFMRMNRKGTGIVIVGSLWNKP